MGISVCCIGTISYIQNNQIMVVVALFFRACQGCCRVLIQVPSFSMLFILYPNEKLKYTALMESAMNIGVAIGPVIGSALYSLVGYFWMFIIPSYLNADQEDLKSLVDNSNSNSFVTLSKISLLTLMSNCLVLL